MKSEYEDFIASMEVAPGPKVSQNIVKDARQFIQPSLGLITGKYLALFGASIFISLSLCPQSGIGLFRSEYPLFHHFFHQNIVICAIYCAAVFFLTTHLLAFLFLTRFEKISFSKKLIYLPVAPLALSFGFFMMVSPIGVRDHYWNKPYALTWITTATLLFIVWKLGLEKIFAHSHTGGRALP